MCDAWDAGQVARWSEILYWDGMPDPSSVISKSFMLLISCSRTALFRTALGLAASWRRAVVNYMCCARPRSHSTAACLRLSRDCGALAKRHTLAAQPFTHLATTEARAIAPIFRSRIGDVEKIGIGTPDGTPRFRLCRSAPRQH